ncbi:hypothetical protein A7K94_0220960, partial [Modestobacter sp. VKM Ac-2676]
MHARRWADLTPGQQTAVLVAASGQLSLAATAWADLATRPADQVNGPKSRWALIIAVSWIGPLAWFRWGRVATAPGEVLASGAGRRAAPCA